MASSALDPFGRPCRCRCHAHPALVEPDPTRTCPTCGTSWTAEVDACPQCRATCCDMHNQHCEPPSQLCCGSCSEAAHDTFPLRHADGSKCVLEAE